MPHFSMKNIVWMKSFQLPTAQLSHPNGHHDKVFQWDIFHANCGWDMQQLGFLETSWLPSLGPSVSFSYGSQQRLRLLVVLTFFLHCLSDAPDVSRMRKPTLVWKVLKIECKPLTTGCVMQNYIESIIISSPELSATNIFSCQYHIKITSGKMLLKLAAAVSSTS